MAQRGGGGKSYWPFPLRRGGRQCRFAVAAGVEEHKGTQSAWSNFFYLALPPLIRHPYIPPLICRQKCIGVGVGSGRPWSAVVARSSEYYCGGGGKTAPATREDAFPQAPEKFYRKAIQSFSERTLTIEGGGRAALGFRPHSHVHRNGGGGRKGALLTN